jgi:hypothetical protein
MHLAERGYALMRLLQSPPDCRMHIPIFIPPVISSDTLATALSPPVISSSLPRAGRGGTKRSAVKSRNLAQRSGPKKSRPPQAGDSSTPLHSTRNHGAQY